MSKSSTTTKGRESAARLPAIHPGEHLIDEMEEIGLPPAQMAASSLKKQPDVLSAADRTQAEAHPRAIGCRLKELREALGLRQAQFAERVGLSATTYNNYEVGLSRPDIENALRIARALRVGLDWIYLGQERQVPQDIYDLIIEYRKRKQDAAQE